MNSRYKAFYYLRSNGRAPLEAYFKKVKQKIELTDIKAHIYYLIDQKCDLPPPYIKHIWQKVYELRFKSIGGQQRIFYFIHNKKIIILLDGYTKRTNKIPIRILKRIKKYYIDYLNTNYDKEYE